MEKKLSGSIYNLASNFIKEITIDSDPLSQLYSVLTARGFLLEDEIENPAPVSNEIFLSNNSHKCDCPYLDQLLKKYGIGFIFPEDSPFLVDYKKIPMQRWPINITSDFTHENLFGIFLSHRHGGEAGSGWDFGERNEFNRFKKREHGIKVLVSILDPYIARLVKSVNAIGLYTVSSCDGNYGRNARIKAIISFRSTYDYNWFDFLWESYITHLTPLALSGEWNTHNEFTIIDRQNNPLELYLEIQKVAEIIYHNRMELRKKKLDTFQEITFENKFRWA